MGRKVKGRRQTKGEWEAGKEREGKGREGGSKKGNNGRAVKGGKGRNGTHWERGKVGDIEGGEDG